MREHPIRWYTGVPPVEAFGTVDGKGTPIVIDTSTNTGYYLAPDNTVRPFGGASSWVPEPKFLRTDSGATLSADRLTWTYNPSSGSAFACVHSRSGAGRSGLRYFEVAISGSTAIGYFLGFMGHSAFDYSMAGKYPENPYGMPSYLITNSNRFGTAIGRLANGVAFADADFNFTTGDIIKVAVDFDSGNVWMGKNATWFKNQAPVSGTAHFNLPSANFDIYGCAYGINPENFIMNFKFSSGSWVYSAPADFLPL